jgi:hypothetical protein
MKDCGTITIPIASEGDMTKYEKLCKLIEQWTRAEILARYARLHRKDYIDYVQLSVKLQNKVRKYALGSGNILELGYKWNLIRRPEDIHADLVSAEAKRLRKAKRMRVVHCKKEPYDVYIGRSSKWGNPFRIGKHGTRKEVIRKYRKWILRQPKLLNSLDEICGKVLGCWCSPKSCHGDVLIELCKRTSQDMEGKKCRK